MKIFKYDCRLACFEHEKFDIQTVVYAGKTVPFEHENCSLIEDLHGPVGSIVGINICQSKILLLIMKYRCWSSLSGIILSWKSVVVSSGFLISMGVTYSCFKPLISLFPKSVDQNFEIIENNVYVVDI